MLGLWLLAKEVRIRSQGLEHRPPGLLSEFDLPRFPVGEAQPQDELLASLGSDDTGPVR